MPGQRAMGRGVGEGRRKAPAPEGEEPLFRESPPPLPFPGGEGWRIKVFSLLLSEFNLDSSLFGTSCGSRPGNGASAISARSAGNGRINMTSTSNKSRTSQGSVISVALPVILLLLQSYGTGNVSWSRLGQSFSHNLCISRTNVGGICGFACLLKLCCENGDGDGNQDGRLTMAGMEYGIFSSMILALMQEAEK